jgi:ABC-type glycerol-3-phosphate transport system substrate-binding protein
MLLMESRRYVPLSSVRSISIVPTILVVLLVCQLHHSTALSSTNTATPPASSQVIEVYVQGLENLPRVIDAANEYTRLSGFTINITASANGITRLINVFLPGNSSGSGGTRVETNATLTSSFLPDVILYKSRYVIDIIKYLQPLNQLINADDSLAWQDIFSILRSYLATFNGVIYCIPLNGPLYHMNYRTDLLVRDSLPFPQSWSDFNYIAKLYQGQDLNNDTEPDYGVCIGWSDSEVLGDLFYTIFSAYAQTNFTSQGIFFDLETFDPLVDNDAYRTALRVCTTALPKIVVPFSFSL